MEEVRFTNIEPKNILAIDIGSTMGWAKCSFKCVDSTGFPFPWIEGGKMYTRDITSGHIKLGTKKLEDEGRIKYRGYAFLRWLELIVLDKKNFTGLTRDDNYIIVYEDVKGHVGHLDASMYGQFLGILKCFCAQWNVPMVGIHTGTMKKHVGGKGNAPKEVIMENVSKYLGREITSHDEADALGVLITYLETKDVQSNKKVTAKKKVRKRVSEEEQSRHRTL